MTGATTHDVGPSASSDTRFDAALAPFGADPDGTLILSDSLHEGLNSVISLRPMRLFSVVRSLKHGNAAFKREIVRPAPALPPRCPTTPICWLISAPRRPPAAPSVC